MPNASDLPEPLPIVNSGANPNIAFRVTVGDPSGPVSASNLNSDLPSTDPDPFEMEILPLSVPTNSPISGAKSPNGPPSSPDRIFSIACAWSSETPSSTTTPTFQFPALMLAGKWLKSAKLVPPRSVSSRFPLLIWKTATPMHWSLGPVGVPSTGHGQISLQSQMAVYLPAMRYAMDPSSTDDAGNLQRLAHEREGAFEPFAIGGIVQPAARTGRVRQRDDGEALTHEALAYARGEIGAAEQAP